MSKFEIELKKCEEILKHSYYLEGRPLKNGSSVLVFKDTDCDVLILKRDGYIAMIGFMNDPDWISCYEFNASGEFESFEPMKYEHMGWALNEAPERSNDLEIKK